MTRKNSSKSVVVVTGARSEYGLLKPVMQAMMRHPRLHMHVIASGMHLAKRLGDTWREIAKDGFTIACKVSMDPDADSGPAMARAIARGIRGFQKALTDIRPDWVLVLGDRIEALAASIAASYSGFAIAHVHGGDLSAGGLDESARHAITRFAHLHLAATQGACRRLRRMGEEAHRIHHVGAPGLDHILHHRLPSLKAMEQALSIQIARPLVLIVQHPVTTQIAQAARQMRITLSAVRGLGGTILVSHPNSDAGARAMSQVIAKHAGKDGMHAYKNFPHAIYLALLKHADVMVGNSSSGIIEAPSFRTAVVNIGIRQEGRERAANIIDAPHDKAAIQKAIRRALSKRFQERLKAVNSPYGNGTAGKTIARILACTRATPEFLQKRLVLP